MKNFLLTGISSPSDDVQGVVKIEIFTYIKVNRVSTKPM